MHWQLKYLFEVNWKNISGGSLEDVEGMRANAIKKLVEVKEEAKRGIRKAREELGKVGGGGHHHEDVGPGGDGGSSNNVKA